MVQTGLGFQVSGFRFQASDFRLKVSGFRFQASGFGFRISGCGFQVSGLRSQVSSLGLRERRMSSPGTSYVSDYEGMCVSRPARTGRARLRMTMEPSLCIGYLGIHHRNSAGNIPVESVEQVHGLEKHFTSKLFQFKTVQSMTLLREC